MNRTTPIPGIAEATGSGRRSVSEMTSDEVQDVTATMAAAIEAWERGGGQEFRSWRQAEDEFKEAAARLIRHRSVRQEAGLEAIAGMVTKDDLQTLRDARQYAVRLAHDEIAVVCKGARFHALTKALGLVFPDGPTLVRLQ